MSEYLHLARYFYDDKDIGDLVEAGKISNKFLLKFLKKRGIVMPDLNKEWSRDRLIYLFSRQMFAWTDIIELGAEIKGTARKEKTETYRMPSVPNDYDVGGAIQSLKRERSSKKQEDYTISKKSDGSFKVDVRYTEIDPNLARPFQKRENTSSFEIKLTNKTVEVLHESNDRARQIAEVFSGLIMEDCAESEAPVRIEFPTLKNAALRSSFFHSLIEKIEGFRVLDVQDVKVDNRIEIEDIAKDDSEPEEDAELTEQQELLKGVVRKAVFTGSSVLTSDIYQQLTSKGYFISSITWRGLEIAEDHEVDFHAEMTDPIKFGGYKFNVNRIQPLNQTGEAFRFSRADFARKYLKRLRDGSFIAKSILDKKINNPESE